MSGLTITLTSAGRASQINAENTGTAPVVIAAIGVTDQEFVSDAGMAVLPGELKRLVTFAGAAVAPDTIHVTIRDDSLDVYSMRGFGLYLEDGTLYAVYGQADVILEKSSQAMMLLAADIIFTDVDTSSIAFGDTTWINPPATTEVQGVLELATDAEAIVGEDRTRGMTPGTHKSAVDARFGAGAPSGFFKPLLAMATAAAVRAALELKGASLKDTGSGNGLDADLLDGQHGAHYLAWANQTGVPASFPPSAHGHAWGELSGVPLHATRWPSFDEVTGKPATFPPSAHSHDAAVIVSGTFDVARIPVLQISKTAGLQEALNAKAPVHDAVHTGSMVLNCSGPADTLQVNNPAGTPAGSYVQLGGPNTAPGIVGQHGATKRRDIRFTDVGIEFGASTTSSSPAIRMTLDEAGALTVSGGFQKGSSRLVKHDIRPLPYGLDEINAIVTRIGRYRPEYVEDQRQRLFVIAEQLQKIIPEAVRRSEDGTLTVDYTDLVPPLIQAVQELSDMVHALVGEVRALKAA